MSILDWIKFILFAGIPNIPAFIHSRPGVADKRVISVRTAHPYYCSLTNAIIQAHRPSQRDEEIQEIGHCGASTVPRYNTDQGFDIQLKSSSITRYCYGGSTAVRFAGREFIHSAVICHPGGCKISEVEAIRVPTSWACAEGTIQSLRRCIYAEFLQQRTFSGLVRNACNVKQFFQGKKRKKMLLNMNSKTIKVGRSPRKHTGN